MTKITFEQSSPKKKKISVQSFVHFSALILSFLLRALQILFGHEILQKAKFFHLVWCQIFSYFSDLVFHVFQVYCSCGCTYTREQPHLSQTVVFKFEKGIKVTLFCRYVLDLGKMLVLSRCLQNMLVGWWWLRAHKHANKHVIY